MSIVMRTRRSRWWLAAILLVTGIVLHQSPVAAQDAGRPDATLDVQASDRGAPDGVAVNGASAPAMEADLVERIANVVTNPAVAVLLIAGGVLLVLVDLFTAGFGLAGLLGIGLLALFFWGHAVAGLAGWESVALVAAGVVLLALEVFVIPGFGVAGVLGLAALVGGLFLSLIGDENVTREAVVRAGSTISISVITIVAGIAALLWLLPQLPWLRELVLQTNVPLPETGGSRDSMILGAALDSDERTGRDRSGLPEPRSLRGASGVAISDLRPSGFARIDGIRVDVISRGEYIPAGAPVEVIADEGYRRVVRQLAERDAGAAGVR